MTDVSTPTWPLFGLVVRTPRLVLRYATDEDLAQLALFRRGRVIAEGEEPFDGESTFYMESPMAQWRAVAGEWGARARTSSEWWHMSFTALVAGEVVGQQNITGVDFRRLGTVNSFSFLAKTHQGQGLGREMRSAVLHLAFAGLGAQRAESDAFADNHASLAVSRALGYEPNGTMVGWRPSGASLMIRHLLTRERWEPMRRSDIEIDGLEPCLALLGLDPP
jgi:RimJ/RimL family protein N-acetyltransferase